MRSAKSLFGPVDILLVTFIVLNLLDFFEIIPSELDYAKKILSWALLGYLLYKVSLTRVLFGRPDLDLDVLLIASYFLLVLKNLISYAAVAYPTASEAMKPFFKLLIDHHTSYELVSFAAGLTGLVLIAAFVAWRVPFLSRSVMGVLHEQGKPKRALGPVLGRFALTLLVLLGFFLYVFNMVMEWLAIAIDATLILFALLFYSLFLVRHRVNMHQYLQQVSNAGNNFFKSFVDHFRYRESFLLGMCGLLVLHLLTDIGNFLIPYVTGLRDQLYFGLLGTGHQGVWRVLAGDLAFTPGFLANFALLVVFAGNVVGMVLLFFSPALLWYELYRRRQPRLPRWLLGTFFGCLPAVLLAPLFSLRRMGSWNFIGVDVRTASMLGGAVPLWAVALLMLAIIVAVSLWHHRRALVRVLERLWVAVSVLFLGWYSLLFFLDVAKYYQDVVFGFLRTGMYVMALVFFVFEALVIIFYVGGFAVFVYELVHRSRMKEVSS